jgi:hypothetical protein
MHDDTRRSHDHDDPHSHANCNTVADAAPRREEQQGVMIARFGLRRQLRHDRDFRASTRLQCE